MPDPNDSICGIGLQEIYDHIGQRYFRLMIESYIVLRKKGLKEERDKYINALQKEEFNGLSYQFEQYGGFLTSYKIDYEYGNTGYLTPEVAFGYWLRRLTDESAYNFYLGHESVMIRFDSTWYKDILSQNGFNKYNIWPGTEASHLAHQKDYYEEDILPEEEFRKVLGFIEFNVSDISLKDNYSIYHNSLNYMTNNINWSKFDFMKDIVLSDPRRSYFSYLYKLGSYELLLYGIEYQQMKGGFALVFKGDMMLQEPILLRMRVDQNGLHDVFSDFNVDEEGNIEITYKIVSHTYKSNKKLKSNTSSIKKTISNTDTQFKIPTNIY